MQKITISRLVVPTLIGVYDWERTQNTNLLMSLALYSDVQKAMQSDDVNDTIDYAKVSEKVKQVAADSSFELLEALGKCIGETLMATFPIQHLELCIEKPGILPDADMVSVSFAFASAGPVSVQIT